MGRYAFVKSRDPEKSELTVVKISASIIDTDISETKAELPFSAEIDSNKEIAKNLQVTARLDPDGTKEDRNKIIAEAHDPEKRSVYVHGPGNTLASSALESLYAVEILAKPLEGHETQDAQPQKLRDEKKLAFVTLKQGDLYEVKLYNNSNKDVAATLSIDGLDQYHFTKDRDVDGRPRYTHIIVHPKGYREKGEDGQEYIYDGTATIVGWHNSVEHKPSVLSFLVTGYGQGAVTKAGISARGKVGVIHVQFAHCKPLAPGAKAANGNETGFGPPRNIKQKVVNYEIDPPHDFVTIRYTRPQE